METRALIKLNKEGISLMTPKEKEELINLINKLQEEAEKQKWRNTILEELSQNNLISALKIDKKHNDLLEKHLKEADKKFENAKALYVKGKIDLAETNLHQGYYNALADLKRAGAKYV